MSSGNGHGRSPDKWKALIEELIKGQQLAHQLESQLLEDFPASETRELTRELVATYARALAELHGGAATISTTTPENAMREGSRRTPKIRRRSNPWSSTRVSVKTTDDGRSWRKYGQKAVHNAKFPRCYFRCAHKYDQGCEATRQVQQSEEDPSLYIITYFGEHKCRDPAEVLSASSKLEGDDQYSSCMLDFSESKAVVSGVSSARVSVMQQERSAEEVACSSMSDYLQLPEIGTPDSGLLQPSVESFNLEFMGCPFEFGGAGAFGKDGLS